MRIARVCKDHNIGLKTINALYAFLEIDKTVELNSKEDEENIKFMISQMETFSEYYHILRQAHDLMKKNRKKIFKNIDNKIIKNENLSSYEKHIFIKQFVEEYFYLIGPDSNLLYLKSRSVFDDNDFYALLSFIETYKKNRQTSKEKNVVAVKKDHINEASRINTCVEDYEATIMKALRDGDAEKYGF